MQWSRRRWLAIIGVVATLGIVLAVVPAGGSAANRHASKKSFCSSSKNTKHVTASDLQHYAHRAIHRIYIICAINGGKKGSNGKNGATGATGPPGPAGPAGQSAAGTITIPRTAVPFSSGFMTDGGNVQPLAQSGPIHVDGLCRHTFAGPMGAAATGGSERSGQGSHSNGYSYPRLPAQGGESEAQVIVWSETGSLSFKGAHGHRENVPPGPPDYTQETITSPATDGTRPSASDNAHSPEPNGPVAAVNDPVAGEGQHLFLGATNETLDEERAQDPASDNPNDPSVKQLSEYPAFNYSGGIVATSEGHVAVLDALAGFDVLGVYGECVFAGVLRPLS